MGESWTVEAGALLPYVEHAKRRIPCQVLWHGPRTISDLPHSFHPFTKTGDRRVKDMCDYSRSK
eukprot:4830687-Amphidinium_carterae.2